MSAAKPKRFPWLNALLAVGCLIWGIRSLWVRDIIAWQRVEMQRISVVRTSFGIDVAQFGLGVFHKEELVAVANRAAEREMLESTTPGPSWQTEPTSDAGPGAHGSWARRFG